jgi:hypothetical protein
MDVVSKLLSRVLNKRLFKILKKHGTPFQFGGTPDMGCRDGIFTLKSFLHARRQHGLPTHVAFIDLVKAYDTANHELLLQVLKKYGAPPKLIDVVRRLYTDLKVVLKIGKLKTEILQGVGVRQGDNMAGVLFLFLMTAFADLMEKKFAQAGILRPEMMRESDESFHKGQFIRHDITKCRKSPTLISFIVDLAVYVDDTAAAFPSREQLEKGSRIIQSIFTSLGMEMHIGVKTSETTWGESKTECLYIPPAKELKQLALDMGLSKDDIVLLTNDMPEDDVIFEDNVLSLDDKNEEKQPETQRTRRRKLEERIYEYSNETLPVDVDGGRITYCM